MSNQDAVEQIKQLATELEQQRTRERALQQQQSLVIQIAVAIIGLIALSNLYFVNQLFYEVRLIVQGMEEMLNYFDVVSKRMIDMKESLDGITHDVRLMPVITDQMEQTATDVQTMRYSVLILRTKTTDMDDRLATMGVNMTLMRERFNWLNLSVAGIGSDIQQMARPLP